MDHQMYEKEINILPGYQTLLTLEKRKELLLDQYNANLKKGIKNNNHILNEIFSLEKTLKFLKWILQNSSMESVKNVGQKP